MSRVYYPNIFCHRTPPRAARKINEFGDSYPDSPPVQTIPAKIPLPDEPEHPDRMERSDPLHALSSIFQFLESRIKLEEILLLGLIFILLAEGIKDDLLLMGLLYILLTGRE